MTEPHSGDIHYIETPVHLLQIFQAQDKYAEAHGRKPNRIDVAPDVETAFIEHLRDLFVKATGTPQEATQPPGAVNGLTWYRDETLPPSAFRISWTAADHLEA